MNKLNNKGLIGWLAWLVVGFLILLVIVVSFLMPHQITNNLIPFHNNSNIGNGTFIQDEFFPLKDYKIDSINTSEFNKINKMLKNVSYEPAKKQIILQTAKIGRAHV